MGPQASYEHAHVYVCNRNVPYLTVHNSNSTEDELLAVTVLIVAYIAQLWKIGDWLKELVVPLTTEEHQSL
jgi:hypothetical protein